MAIVRSDDSTNNDGQRIHHVAKQHRSARKDRYFIYWVDVKIINSIFKKCRNVAHLKMKATCIRKRQENLYGKETSHSQLLLNKTMSEHINFACFQRPY